GLPPAAHPGPDGLRPGPAGGLLGDSPAGACLASAGGAVLDLQPAPASAASAESPRLGTGPGADGCLRRGGSADGCGSPASGGCDVVVGCFADLQPGRSPVCGGHGECG